MEAPMRQKTTIINIISLSYLIMVLLQPLIVNAFDGRNDKPGSHMELTTAAFKDAYRAPSGKAVLERTIPVLGFSYYRYEPCRAVNLLADASRDTDIYYFGPLYPHAQTLRYNYKKSFTYIELEAIETDALAQYFNFMTKMLGNARRCYENGESRTALYWLGFYLHGYEDLFAHKGITNEQHIWLEKKIQNPDDDPESMQQCRESLPQLAINLPSLLGEKAGDDFKKQITTDTEIAILTKKEREKILQRKPDILWEGIKYKLIAGKDSYMRYIRQMSWDHKTIARMLNSAEVIDTLAGIKDQETLKAFLKKQGYDFQVNYVHPDKFNQD
jgi:hypothetical protein